MSAQFERSDARQKMQRGYGGQICHDSTATQISQMHAELEDARRQLAEEWQVSQKLRELLVTQRAEYTQEIASLKRTKDKLSTEMLDLIQDLERTLSEPCGNREPLATMKRVLSERSLATAMPETGKTEKSERLIPNWNEIIRHFGQKDDDGSSNGSIMTRCASSLSSTTSQTSLSDA